ncbi:MAG: dNTP triphosphohydrolase [candidate division WS1 bacterium]|jgi:dGTPase|nr:dNTP triphosphohydrolase [candidate division WS1 bacterium]
MLPPIRDRGTATELLDSRLSPLATPNAGTGARLRPEAECHYRPPFQRDVGRIVHCQSFRRLQYCTQVFLNNAGDFYRTRLTHAIAVAQIAKTLARSLGANEDLVEAIALAHDVGHPPFGHAGEEALGALMRGHGYPNGFEHNGHGLRVLDELERRAPGMRGLNLTYEVREGIARHSTPYDRPPQLPGFDYSGQPSLECQIVNLADPLAYRSHDLDDALATGILSMRELDSAGLELWDRARYRADLDAEATDDEVRIAVVRGLIEMLIVDALTAASETIEAGGVRCRETLRALDEPLVQLSDETRQADHALAGFLHERMYRHPIVARMNIKGRRIIEDLFEVLMGHPQALSEPFRARVIERAEPAAPVVCDFLATLTDRSAMDLHADLFDPSRPAGADPAMPARF